ncbi:hypothetical protein THASP1DRAFT_28968 [Thamnocephalis sphaerospora]|uniref:Macro domain-like protein n=1 Tax=Thamnocephalis sphaerospora TaxID=78915 RepID=A0A4P9XSX2_9FUNG|nr:hypothetical protein THASP1DRAFT_28968 [Thamnocephalis sphaerospora]|eukprot:RKP09237.1 hypothetical protein THASP1DRAFT_28968 [Thamnocephalis sphaerospora]
MTAFGEQTPPPYAATRPPYCFSLLLTDPASAICSQWHSAFGPLLSTLDLPPAYSEQPPELRTEVQVRAARFSDLPSTPDCLAVPSTSFGLLRGLLGDTVAEWYGGGGSDTETGTYGFVTTVQRALERTYCGQQPEGTCVLVDMQPLLQRLRESGDERPRPRWLALLAVVRASNVAYVSADVTYKCTWALLCAVRAHNAACAALGTTTAATTERINTVACPGIGTGVYGVPVPRAALQMALAFRHFIEAPANGGKTDGANGAPDQRKLWEWNAGHIRSWTYARQIANDVLATILPPRD